MTTPTMFDALGLTLDATTADVSKAYKALARQYHPDMSPDTAERFALVSAAFQQLKTETGLLAYRRNARLGLFNGSEKAWARNWLLVTNPTAEPEADAPKTGDLPRFVFTEREGESKDDRRRRYARESQAFRYRTDPYYAAQRRAASKRSQAKKKS